MVIEFDAKIQGKKNNLLKKVNSRMLLPKTEKIAEEIHVLDSMGCLSENPGGTGLCTMVLPQTAHWQTSL